MGLPLVRFSECYGLRTRAQTRAQAKLSAIPARIGRLPLAEGQVVTLGILCPEMTHSFRKDCLLGQACTGVKETMCMALRKLLAHTCLWALGPQHRPLSWRGEPKPLSGKEAAPHCPGILRHKGPWAGGQVQFTLQRMHYFVCTFQFRLPCHAAGKGGLLGQFMHPASGYKQLEIPC